MVIEKYPVIFPPHRATGLTPYVVAFRKARNPIPTPV